MVVTTLRSKMSKYLSKKTIFTTKFYDSFIKQKWSSQISYAERCHLSNILLMCIQYRIVLKK